MDTRLGHSLLPLRKGTARSVRGGAGRGVAVFQGHLWVTQTGDLRDVILGPGESFAFDRPGTVVLQALTDASVLLLEPGADDANRPVERARIDAVTLHQAARRMRSAAIGRALADAIGALGSAASRAAQAIRRTLHDWRGPDPRHAWLREKVSDGSRA
jgi:hypothetical protein